METTATDAQGFYEIANVLPGDYRLKVDSGADGFTIQGTGVTDGDSEVSPATGTSPVFQLASGVSDDTRDAGLVGPCYGIDLVANGFWKWWTPGASDSVPSDWNQASFTGEGSWQEGFSPLGYSVNSRAVTEITIPDSANDRYANYFRHTFEAPDPQLFQDGLQLTLTHRGGVIVYLNGSEILRRNLPWGAAVGAGTWASTDSDTVETVSIPAELLLSGSNLLAVELHRYKDDEGDLDPGLFNLALAGKVCGSCRVKEVVVATTTATTIKASSTSDFGTSSLLQLGGSSERSVLVSWNLSSIPQGADVLQAEMMVFVTAATNDSYAIHELLRPWNESGSTRSTWSQVVRGTPGTNWAAAGAKGAADSSPVRLGMMPLGSDSEVNISAQAPLNAAGRSIVEKWINNPATNFGFLIDAETGSNNTLEFSSDDNTSNVPQLRVIYLDLACQP